MPLSSHPKPAILVALCTLVGLGMLATYLASWPAARPATQPATAVRFERPAPATPAPAATPRRQAREQTAAARPMQAGTAAVASEFLLQGRDLIAVGEWAAAVEAFQLAVEFNPNAETNGALGALYFRMAAANQALVHLRRAVEMDPYSADGWIALANALQLRGNPSEAMQALEQARKLEPGLVTERDSSGFVYRLASGAESVFSASPYIPSKITRRIP